MPITSQTKKRAFLLLALAASSTLVVGGPPGGNTGKEVLKEYFASRQRARQEARARLQGSDATQGPDPEASEALNAARRERLTERFQYMRMRRHAASLHRQNERLAGSPYGGSEASTSSYAAQQQRTRAGREPGASPSSQRERLDGAGIRTREEEEYAAMLRREKLEVNDEFERHWIRRQMEGLEPLSPEAMRATVLHHRPESHHGTVDQLMRSYEEWYRNHMPRPEALAHVHYGQDQAVPAPLHPAPAQVHRLAHVPPDEHPQLSGPSGSSLSGSSRHLEDVKDDADSLQAHRLHHRP